MYDFHLMEASVVPATAAVWRNETTQQKSRDSFPTIPRRRASMAGSNNSCDMPEPRTPRKMKKRVRFTTSHDLQEGQVQVSIREFTKPDIPANELWWSNADRKRSRKACRRIVDSFRDDDEYTAALKTLMKSYKSRITCDDLNECYEILSDCSMARGFEIHLAPLSLQLGHRHVVRVLQIANKKDASDGELCRESIRSSRAHVAFAKAMAECDSREAALARLF